MQRDAHEAACMPSTWLQKSRRLPCLCPDAAVCGSAASLPSRYHFAFVRAGALAICPEKLACCARSDCTAPCRGATTPLLAAEALTHIRHHRRPLHPASAPLAAFVRSSGVKSAYRDQPAWLARVGRRGRQASFIVAKAHWWRYEAPEGHSRLCCRRHLRLKISSIQGDVSYCCASPYFKPGVLGRFSAQVPVLNL